mmetsp:Transcript_15625/g.37737  ORF Transcript_15625/g.37737 Transcript_15625/m.37737 type:complete len:329 (-) Transcript_15625:317-1303(-)
MAHGLARVAVLEQRTEDETLDAHPVDADRLRLPRVSYRYLDALGLGEALALGLPCRLHVQRLRHPRLHLAADGVHVRRVCRADRDLDAQLVPDVVRVEHQHSARPRGVPVFGVWACFSCCSGLLVEAVEGETDGRAVQRHTLHEPLGEVDLRSALRRHLPLRVHPAALLRVDEARDREGPVLETRLPLCDLQVEVVHLKADDEVKEVSTARRSAPRTIHLRSSHLQHWHVRSSETVVDDRDGDLFARDLQHPPSRPPTDSRGKTSPAGVAPRMPIRRRARPLIRGKEFFGAGCGGWRDSCFRECFRPQPRDCLRKESILVGELRLDCR